MRRCVGGSNAASAGDALALDNFDGLDNVIKNFMWTAVGEVLPDASINSARSPSLALALHVSFVVISTVVLLSLLIGMMSMTYATDTSAGRRIWWFEYASLVLRYEARLSAANKIYYRCGTFDRCACCNAPKKYVYMRANLFGRMLTYADCIIWLCRVA